MSTPGPRPTPDDQNEPVEEWRPGTQTIPRNESTVPMAVLQPAGVPKAALPVAVVTKRTTAEEWMAAFTVPRERRSHHFLSRRMTSCHKIRRLGSSSR